MLKARLFAHCIRTGLANIRDSVHHDARNERRIQALAHMTTRYGSYCLALTSGGLTLALTNLEITSAQHTGRGKLHLTSAIGATCIFEQCGSTIAGIVVTARVSDEVSTAQRALH